MKTLTLLLIIISVLISSCSRNGYGCKGRNPLITRVKTM